MSTAAMRTRLAKLEKRQQRLAGRELTDVEKARRIGFSLFCAAHQVGTQDARDAGRYMAIMLVRNRQRAGGELSQWLADLLLRVLVGEASATNEA